MITAKEYLNSKGFYNTNMLNNCFGEEVAITDMLLEYATEAIKADRERIAESRGLLITYTDYHAEVDKESILNLPIELK